MTQILKHETASRSVLEDFKNGTFGEFSTQGPWTAECGDMRLTETTTGSPQFWFDETRADMDVSFTYTAETIETGDRFVIRFRLIPSTGDRIELQVNGGSITVRQVGGGPGSVSDGTVTTEPGVTYRVRIRADRDRVRIWRNKLGEAPALIFDGGGYTLLTNSRIQIFEEAGADFRFDNFAFHFWNNLHEFLKLEGSSPCIDAVKIFNDEDPPEEITDVIALKYRDFDDQFGPLDGPVEPDIVIRRDMGADEFSTPAASSFWWRRF